MAGGRRDRNRADTQGRGEGAAGGAHQRGRQDEAEKEAGDRVQGLTRPVRGDRTLQACDQLIVAAANQHDCSLKFVFTAAIGAA